MFTPGLSIPRVVPAGSSAAGVPCLPVPPASRFLRLSRPPRKTLLFVKTETKAMPLKGDKPRQGEAREDEASQAASSSPVCREPSTNWEDSQAGVSVACPLLERKQGWGDRVPCTPSGPACSSCVGPCVAYTSQLGPRIRKASERAIICGARPVAFRPARVNRRNPHQGSRTPILHR